jgi:uncharacterized integral membrane protein
MAKLANLLIAAILATCAIGAALISVQNATLVSVQWFGARTVQMPLGLLLAGGFGAGAIAAGVLPLLPSGKPARR